MAQLVEQLTCNQQVVGSSPIASSIMDEFPSGQRGQTVNLLADVFSGSNPLSSTKLGRIAQLGEHLPYKQRVTGSIPVVTTI